MNDVQVTSTGERKLVDVMDLTGAGDVDTSTVKTICDGVIEGLTGTKLKVRKRREEGRRKRDHYRFLILGPILRANIISDRNHCMNCIPR